ncbi:MAG: 4Fe-4S binding protein [Deltaproteobacteria bacterium]|nr:4Fe-4S binding protein [Deltaproteobacteria bacterium]
MTRREFLRYSAEAGLTVALAGSILKFSSNRTYIRPPGAASEDEFFRKCIKCGACIEVCPSHALDFVGLSADMKNIGTPKLNVRHGGCIAWKTPCLKCIQACPANALIKPHDISEIRLGSAFIRMEECVNCLMCFHECPIPGAVLFPNPNGHPYKAVKDIPCNLYTPRSPFKPYIDNNLCTGCGLCAHICPPRCIDITPERQVRMGL